jgi:hypothetical protein
MRSATTLLTCCLLSAPIAAGCATQDYGRITAKMADYEAQASKDKEQLDAATDKSTKLTCLNRLIRNTELQLKIARRISPSTDPQYKDGEKGREAARADKDKRVAALETRLADYRKQRESLSSEK